MVQDPGSLRARLKDGTDQAWRLYCALEIITPYKGSRTEQIRTSRQKLTASTIPWNAAAAGLVLELHTEARRLEVHLKEKVTGQLGSRRGGSKDNTRYALNALPNLSEAVDDQTVLGVFNVITGWNRKADAVLHPENGLHRVPREPGEAELRCPYCTYQTMRWHPGTGIIVCVNPECTNDGGVRPRWSAEFAVTDDQLQFAWTELKEAA